MVTETKGEICMYGDPETLPPVAEAAIPSINEPPGSQVVPPPKPKKKKKAKKKAKKATKATKAKAKKIKKRKQGRR